ncbi:(Fe-S)-binding protein [Aeropyrum camini]|uniref:Fe-S oxidoreductase n=1 Tax=Aeropyrum camini SY1 = JCM 12091 TaxID=1198449 RepID=U3TET9_9CREN|nr:(Fe-S)-binding protein [Aeropyrum camini]BAN89844.1 Fe-S oxidoreductase [Aeropyrum camini SY1 = JCM 12091]
MAREGLDGTLEFLKVETSKCIYCGFCEPVCPTLPFGKHRGYGPRGRVFSARLVALDGKATEGDLESLYSCLLCGACMEVCPARIDIVSVVRAARALISGLEGV